MRSLRLLQINFCSSLFLCLQLIRFVRILSIVFHFGLLTEFEYYSIIELLGLVYFSSF